MQLLAKLWREESGQGMAEYGLILALVAVICIAGFKFLGDQVKSRVENVGNAVMQ